MSLRLICKVLAQNDRWQIMQLLHNSGAMRVSDIGEAIFTDPDQAVKRASYHLNILKQSGLLTSANVGKEVWYSIPVKLGDMVQTAIEELSSLATHK